MTATLILDGVLIALLSATVGYCVVLERRLRALRADHGAFVRMIGEFATATARAEDGIARLAAASAEHGAKLDERTAAARAATDELAFLADRAERLADRLAAVPANPRFENPRPREAESAGSGRKTARKPTGPGRAGLPLGVARFPAPLDEGDNRASINANRARETAAKARPGESTSGKSMPGESAIERDLRRAIRAARGG